MWVVVRVANTNETALATWIRCLRLTNSLDKMLWVVGHCDWSCYTNETVLVQISHDRQDVVGCIYRVPTAKETVLVCISHLERRMWLGSNHNETYS